MGFSTFMVVLDPEQPVYISGQAVRGYLTVASQEDVPCKKITVTFMGKAKVLWSEGSGKTRRTYKAKELYFRHQDIVWDGAGSGNTMGPGDRRFPFSFILPQDIPSSFASSHGNVIYKVKAEAERTWGVKQHKVYFSVNFLYDLNLNPFAVEPMNLQEEETACCWCCAQGPVDMKMMAERSGYVSGESIVVNGEIINHSRSTIKHTEIKLVQVITFFTKSRKKTSTRTIERVYHPKLKGGERDVWSSVSLPIPALPATELVHCNIINMNYVILVEAKFGACRSATALVPVIIGALPLRTTYSTFVPRPFTAESGGTTITHSSFYPSHPPFDQPQEPLSTYNGNLLSDECRDVPAPSYASCIFGKKMSRRVVKNDDDDKDSTKKKFLPRYIIYTTQR